MTELHEEDLYYDSISRIIERRRGGESPSRRDTVQVQVLDMVWRGSPGTCKAKQRRGGKAGIGAHTHIMMVSVHSKAAQIPDLKGNFDARVL